MSEEVQTPNSPTPTVESQPSNEEPLTNADEDNRPANAQSETAKVVDDKQTKIDDPMSNESLTTLPSQDSNVSLSGKAAPSSSSVKIEILLKAVGNAPILKKKKFLLERSRNIQYVVEWLRKYMKLEAKEQLFLYVNQEFAPSLDADIGTIFDCFGVGNNVILHYCTTPAWG